MKAKLLVPTLIVAALLATFIHQNITASPKADGEHAAVTITSANIDALLAGDQPVLIDFWASWCGPCRMIAPTVEELAAEYKGKVVIGKVDVDAEAALANKYGIRSIPNLKLIKDGKVVEDIVGVKPKASLKASIEKHL